MAKVKFELQVSVSYYVSGGVPIDLDTGYCKTIFGGNVEYRESEIFYRKRFEGKGVWATLDVVEDFRRSPDFKAEVDAAALEKGIDYQNRKIYIHWVSVERIKEK